MGKLYSRKERESFRCALMEWRWHGEAGSWLLRRGGILCGWLGEHIWLSLIGPRLEVGTKIRGAISNQVLV